VIHELVVFTQTLQVLMEAINYLHDAAIRVCGPANGTISIDKSKPYRFKLEILILRPVTLLPGRCTLEACSKGGKCINERA